MNKRSMRFLIVFLLSIALISCSGSDSDNGEPQEIVEPDPTSGSSDELFDPDTMVEVSIQMASEDWNFIRTQDRELDGPPPGEACYTGPFESPFIYRTGSVTVNGVTLDNVGIRKKGFVGSIDDYKPSLKIKFDEFVEGQEMFELDRLTLNNNIEDIEHVRQCVAYQLFTEAGVPAPRCNFAHVTVNGRSLGYFSHIESIKKRFLARHFDDNDGHLYEGTISDFSEVWDLTFEKKTNRDNPDRSDLDAVVAALNLPDEELEAALSSLIDIDEFMNFWAMETLIGRADSYPSGWNNFYIYFDPTSDLMHFIPWGTDTSFIHYNKYGIGLIQPRAKLARRLYMLPSTQSRYIAAIQDILDNIWDEEALIAEIDRMQALIFDYTPEGLLKTENEQADSTETAGMTDPAGADTGIGRGINAKDGGSTGESIRNFINGRRAEFGPILNDPPLWTEPEYAACYWREETGE